MKKMFLIAFALICVTGLTVAQAQEMIIDAKAGTSYAQDPGKFGFNSAIEAGVALNPYFALVAMPGFTWYNWDNGLGIQKYEGPGLSSELKTTVNGYMFPVLAAAKIMLPDFKDDLGIVPYVTVGAGYSWLKYSYSTPAYDYDSTTHIDKDSGSITYKGLTWIALAGITYKLGDTNMNLLAEGGYRGAKLKNGDYEVDMSGFVANVGVSFMLGAE